jgi:HD-like signal output (HDOD) protein
MREYVQGALRDLPALPQVLTKILEETQRDDVSASELEDILSADQAVAARTLKVVNSAYYGLSKEVDSLSQATVVLGIQQIRNLVLSIGALNMLKSNDPKVRQLQQEFWLASIGTAFGAQTIARQRSLPLKDIELTFLGGLLHDLGRLFLFSTLPDAYAKVDARMRDGARNLEAIERAILGMSHTEVGGEMAKRWNFPEALVSFLQDHEGPFESTHSARLFAVHLAGRLALAIVPNQFPPAEPDPVAAAWAGQSESERQKVEDEIRTRVDEFENLFGLLAA